MNSFFSFGDLEEQSIRVQFTNRKRKTRATEKKISEKRRGLTASKRKFVAGLEKDTQRKERRETTNLFCKNVLLALGGNFVSLNFCFQSSFLERIRYMHKKRGRFETKCGLYFCTNGS